MAQKIVSNGKFEMVPASKLRAGDIVFVEAGNLIPGDYIKAKAQAGEMGSRLYAVAVKTPQGFACCFVHL